MFIVLLLNFPEFFYKDETFSIVLLASIERVRIITI